MGARSTRCGVTPTAAISGCAHAPIRPSPSGKPPTPVVTFGEACAEWLRYVEQERRRARSTVRDYRNAVDGPLTAEFGADTPLEAITAERVDRYRERLLREGRLSPRTIQKLLVLLHGIFKRAKRRGWIAANPVADAERVSVKRSGEFSVLSPTEVEALARAAASEQDAAIFTVAAFTGLRLGELRALRWMDVDFAGRVVHVRRNPCRCYVSGPRHDPEVASLSRRRISR